MPKNGVMFFCGPRMREIREERELSPEEVAVATGRSSSSILDYETGDQCPPPHIVEKIAALLRVEVFDLFEEDARAEARMRYFPDAVTGPMASRGSDA